MQWPKTVIFYGLDSTHDTDRIKVIFFLLAFRPHPQQTTGQLHVSPAERSPVGHARQRQLRQVHDAQHGPRDVRQQFPEHVRSTGTYGSESTCCTTRIARPLTPSINSLCTLEVRDIPYTDSFNMVRSVGLGNLTINCEPKDRNALVCMLVMKKALKCDNNFFSTCGPPGQFGVSVRCLTLNINSLYTSKVRDIPYT